LRDHRQRVDGGYGLLRALADRLAVLVLRPAADYVERALAGPRESHADDAARRRNAPQILSGFVEDLHAGVGAHVQPPLRVHRHAVAIAAGWEHGEVVAVGEQAGAFDVERNRRAAIGDIEGCAVRAEGNPVGAQIIRQYRHPFAAA
jgi:hypothetical protein